MISIKYKNKLNDAEKLFHIMKPKRVKFNLFVPHFTNMLGGYQREASNFEHIVFNKNMN